MMTTFRRHFDSIDTPEAAAKFVERWLDVVGQRVVGALLSTAWRVAPEIPTRSFVTGRMMLLRERVTARSPHVYPSVTLDETWLDRGELTLLVRRLLDGSRPEQIPETFQYPSAEHVYSTSESQSGWPETLLKFMCTANRIFPDWMPAVAPGLPPFHSWAQATAAWVYERPAMYGTEVPFGNQFVVIMPDTRARASAISPHQVGLAINVEGHLTEQPFELQYVFSGTAGQFESGALHVRDNLPIPISACPNATELDVYCLDLESGVISHDAFGWQQLREVGATAKADDQDLRDDIGRGERETVEFKPFIRDSAKGQEVIRSVVAFANSSGGRVYVGVRDDGQPQGRGALKSFQTAEDPAGTENVLTSLKKLVHDNIRPIPDAMYRSAELAGEPICVIEVAPGPYIYSTHDNEILIRKGSTNRRPDPSAELAPLMASRRSAPGMAHSDGWPFDT